MLDISVVIPNYNHANYISQALDAIIQQKPSEIIVVDDASTDNSVEILLKYQKKYPVLKIFQRPNNNGPIEAFNYGLKHASKQFIAL